MNSGRVRMAVVLGGVFLVLGLFRVNDLSLYTDSTRYLIWGHSLSEFRGYIDDTQPLPSRFVMNAPLYPILLAPVQWVFPLSVEAAKTWTLLFGSIAIAFFFLWLRKYCSTMLSVTLTLILSFNPLLLIVSTEILSEAPFMALVAILFLVSDDFFDHSHNTRTRLTFLGSIAVLMLLREVGAAFVAAALLVLFRQKRGKDLILVGSLAGGLFLLWTLRNSVFVGSPDDGQAANIQYLFNHFVTSDHSSMFSEFFTRSWLNLKGYTVTIGGSILYPFPENLIVSPSVVYEFFSTLANAVKLPLFLLTLAGVVLGIRRDLRSGSSGPFRAISLAGYIVIILFYPVHDIRFFLPLLPVLLFYLAYGWHDIEGRIANAALRRSAAVLVVAALLVPNTVAVWEILRTNHAYRSDPSNFSASIKSDSDQPRYFDQPWSLIGAWIRSNTAESMLIASPVKEIAPFVYPRPVLETSRVLPTPVFERFLRDNNTSFLLTVNAWDSVETFQYQMPESRRLWFEQVAGVAGLRLYKIHSAILDPPQRKELAAIDTSTDRGLLLEGRNALLGLRYHDALHWFAKGLHANPSQPEIAFQVASALSFLGDSVGTMHMVEQLFTLPRATAYTQSVQSIIGIMEQSLKAKQLTNASAQSFALFETGLAYWGLGYRDAARSVMRTVIRLDSTNFVGALWGIYFCRELGDTLESNKFLNRLKAIDRSAQIVGDWDRIRLLGEDLRTSKSRAHAVEIHLALARAYEKIELFDEALDETLRALKLEPSNVDTWLFKSEILEKKKATWGAAEAYRKVLALEPHNSYAKARLDSLLTFRD